MRISWRTVVFGRNFPYWQPRCLPGACSRCRDLVFPSDPPGTEASGKGRSTNRGDSCQSQSFPSRLCVKRGVGTSAPTPAWLASSGGVPSSGLLGRRCRLAMPSKVSGWKAFSEIGWGRVAARPPRCGCSHTRSGGIRTKTVDVRNLAAKFPLRTLIGFRELPGREDAPVWPSAARAAALLSDGPRGSHVDGFCAFGWEIGCGGCSSRAEAPGGAATPRVSSNSRASDPLTGGSGFRPDQLLCSK